MGLGMGLGMHLGMGMQLKTEQRMELEQRLEQKLALQMEHKMTLEMHLKRESEIQRLLRYAAENDCFRRFKKKGFDFEYALVPYKAAKTFADEAGFGFSHCQYNPFEAMFNGRQVALAKGDWSLFVVEDQVPEEFRDYVAIHERGEELSAGDHYFASQLEFALAAHNHKVRPYTKFVDRIAPGKFVELTQKIHYPVLPEELLDFLSKQEKRNKQELEVAESLIDNHPIPLTVLRKMGEYDDRNKEVKNKLYALRKLQNDAWQMFVERKTLGEVVDNLDKAYRECMLSITPEQERVLVKTDMNEPLRNINRLLHDDAMQQTGKHIYLPKSFDEAYKKARKGERLVDVEVSSYSQELKMIKSSEGYTAGYSLAAQAS